LEAWSTWRRDPKTRLRSILRDGPDGLPPQDIELVTWSVFGQCRELGFGATIFHEMSLPEVGDPPPEGRITILADAETRLQKEYVEQYEEWASKGQLGERPRQPRLLISEIIIPAIDDTTLPPGASHLANWLLHYLNSYTFIRLVVSKSAVANRRLHPHFRRLNPR
jgi:hypothetical protein